MSQKHPRVCAVHDLSGVGRCALTVAIPVLSAMGLQVCPLPTAVLSTHTGGFGRVASRDLTRFMEASISHWSELALDFDGIYSGYLASEEQVRQLSRLIRTAQPPEGALVLVDPVMADHGTLYSSMPEAMPALMRELVADADYITPNLTEACLLSGVGYEESARQPADVCRLLKRLLALGCRNAIVTGVPIGRGRSANVCMRAGDSGYWAVDYPLLPAAYPGGGDLFASVLMGWLTLGEPVGESLAKATDFAFRAVRATQDAGTPAREGLIFEPMLLELRAPVQAAARYVCM